MNEKKQVKRKLRNRWRWAERYGQLMFPRDRQSQAPGLIHALYAEPNGYHKGALVRGAIALNARGRLLVRKFRQQTRRKLEQMQAVTS